MSSTIKQGPPDQPQLVIRQGMTIKGTVQSKTDAFVDGVVEGKLDVENGTLTVGPNGKIFASATARDVEIQGIITGDVETSGTTCIRHSGQLFGDIRAGGIVVEIGAVLKGNVEIAARPNGSPATGGSAGVSKDGE